MWYFILCDVFSTYVFTIIYVDIFQGMKGEKKLKVKRNLGTSNRWPHTVPNTCFEVPLDEVLRTSWRRPESTSKGSPLGVRLGRHFKTFPGLKFRCPLDVSLGRPRDVQIGSWKDVLEKLEGDVLGTNIFWLSRFPGNLALNSIQNGHFRGCWRMGERVKKAPLPNICHTYSTIFGTVIPYLKKIQKIYKARDTLAVDISIFPPEISNFCYIKKFR